MAVAPLPEHNREREMDFRMNEGFDRLQRLLVGMRAGEELKPGDAADATGLSPEMCRAVLLGLERAGLMSHEDEDRFVRRTLDIMGS